VESLRGGKMGRVTTFPRRLSLQQRVLPIYRAPFFDALAAACKRGLGVFAGEPRADEAIATANGLKTAQLTRAHNRHILRGPFYLCWQSGLLEWLDDWQPEALIVEANPRYLSTPAGIRWMKQHHGPVLGWGLGAPPSSGPLGEFRRGTRLGFLRQFDALITYSQRGAEEYASLGFSAERVFVAPNAVSPRPTWPLPDRAAGFGERPVMLFVGRLQARKRINLLLQACAGLEKNIQPRLLIVGEGPERERLEALAGKVYPLAEFRGGVYQAELAALFTSADLFILPGTGGLAVQEAMSYGLPVIMGRGDGTNDDLVRAENGWQVAPDDLKALSEALMTALSDVSRLRAMGAESYRIVTEEINLERMVEVFIQALQKLV
jgi:glycosyltransferase involved in cell wall biosynthesis